MTTQSSRAFRVEQTAEPPRNRLVRSETRRSSTSTETRFDDVACFTSTLRRWRVGPPRPPRRDGRAPGARGGAGEARALRASRAPSRAPRRRRARRGGAVSRADPGDGVPSSAHDSIAPDMFGASPGPRSSALHRAARRGDLERVRRLLETRAHDVNEADANGSTALMWACQFGRDDVVEALLRRGADGARATNSTGPRWSTRARPRSPGTSCLRCCRGILPESCPGDERVKRRHMSQTRSRSTRTRRRCGRERRSPPPRSPARTARCSATGPGTSNTTTTTSSI